MYQVLVMSDTHGLTKEINEIKNRHKDIKYMIHCGDSELPVHAPELQGVIQVAGNCDYGEPFPEEKEIHINGLNFFITHGHMHRVKQHLHSLAYYVEDKNVNVVFYGHNHVANACKIGEQLFVNPGSVRFPRARTEKTYAIISWEDSGHVEVNYYTISGEPLSELDLQTQIKNKD